MMENQQNKYDAFISYSHKDSGEVAPAIQKGFENIAKPWWKITRHRTAYRDVTNLSANPHLWERIEEALSQSNFLVLLASPNAATSKWVKKEADWWLKNKSTDSIIIVLVKGEIEWQENDFNWDKTTCLPDELKNAFKGEPLYIDLKEYNTDDKIDYKESRLKTAIVRIISRVTGRSPRDIDSEELRDNRISRILRVAIIAFLSILLLISVLLYLNANQERNKAKNRLKDVQLLRMKGFLRNAQIFKEAGNSLGEQKAREMADSIKIIFEQYSKDSSFKSEMKNLDSLAILNP